MLFLTERTTFLAHADDVIHEYSLVSENGGSHAKIWHFRGLFGLSQLI